MLFQILLHLSIIVYAIPADNLTPDQELLQLMKQRKQMPFADYQQKLYDIFSSKTITNDGFNAAASELNEPTEKPYPDYTKEHANLEFTTWQKTLNAIDFTVEEFVNLQKLFPNPMEWWNHFKGIVIDKGSKFIQGFKDIDAAIIDDGKDPKRGYKEEFVIELLQYGVDQQTGERKYDLQPSIIDGLKKGQVGSYLHRRMNSPWGRRIAFGATVAASLAKIGLLLHEAVLIIAGKGSFGLFLVGGLFGSKFVIHKGIGNGVRILHEMLAPISVLTGLFPSKKSLVRKGKDATKRTAAAVDEFNSLVLTPGSVDPTKKINKITLPEDKPADVILNEFIKNRKTVSLEDFENQFWDLATNGKFDGVTEEGYNAALQSLGHSTRDDERSKMIKFSKTNLVKGLGAAWQNQWNSYETHEEAKNIARGDASDFATSLLEFGAAKRYNLYPKTIQTLSRTRYFTAAKKFLQRGEGQTKMGLQSWTKAGGWLTFGGILGMVTAVNPLAAVGTVGVGVAFPAFGKESFHSLNNLGQGAFASVDPQVHDLTQQERLKMQAQLNAYPKDLQPILRSSGSKIDTIVPDISKTNSGIKPFEFVK